MSRPPWPGRRWTAGYDPLAPRVHHPGGNEREASSDGLNVDGTATTTISARRQEPTTKTGACPNSSLTEGTKERVAGTGVRARSSNAGIAGDVTRGRARGGRHHGSGNAAWERVLGDRDDGVGVAR